MRLGKFVALLVWAVLVIVPGCAGSRPTTTAEANGRSMASDAAALPSAARSDGGNRPLIVATTSILGDVVGALVGDLAEVVTVMPAGVDPHEFAPSAQQVAQIQRADVLVANGAGFEGGLTDVFEAAEAEGAPVFEAITAVEPLSFDDATSHAGHQDEDPTTGSEHDHGHEDDHGDSAVDTKPASDHTHAESGVDPHFFTDPRRMATAARAISEFLIGAVPQLDSDEVRDRTDRYVAALEDLDRELAEQFDAIPAERRVLVTNHEVFTYFADRYGFEVVGTIIPSGTTEGAANAAQLQELAQLMKAKNVSAVFADVSSNDKLARALADQVGSEVQVVELFTESLGPPGSEGATYLDMMRTNGRRIADALS